jgi:serine/threonine protein phosphatase 1
MSKWRPSELNCLYVIPDIHGAYNQLKMICDRILPLRKSDGGQDRLVFLGDYIDRHADSHKVLDFLISIKKKYGDNIDFLIGNHELMFLDAMGLPSPKFREPTSDQLWSGEHLYKFWLANGGIQTILGYTHRNPLIFKESPIAFNRSRVLDLIPKEHINFLLTSLKKYVEIDDYVFVHGGINVESFSVPPQDNTDDLVWNRNMMYFVLDCINKNKSVPWDKVVVAGHNVRSSHKPVVHDKFLMLDCGSPGQLLVVELRSGEAFMSKPRGSRMVKYQLEKTKPKKPSFRRAGL